MVNWEAERERCTTREVTPTMLADEAQEAFLKAMRRFRDPTKNRDTVQEAFRCAQRKMFAFFRVAEACKLV